MWRARTDDQTIDNVELAARSDSRRGGHGNFHAAAGARAKASRWRPRQMRVALTQRRGKTEVGSYSVEAHIRVYFATLESFDMATQI